jgi:hypothetical protein
LALFLLFDALINQVTDHIEFIDGELALVPGRDVEGLADG